jgi:hypothetical protein
MKNKLAVLAALMCLAFAQAAWGQWSSNPALNLPLADNNNGSDQVQPKLVPFANSGGYVSWFDANPATPPPFGFDVFYQRLSKKGYEKFRHGGVMIADLSNSSTEDYGFDVDSQGNALVAFLDTREGSNQQITAEKMGRGGYKLWGRLGVQLTNDSNSHAAPKIAATSDGGVIVAWTSNSSVVAQKLNAQGVAQWGSGVVFSESGYNYLLADLHAADNGSVVISWVREKGFGNATLIANKISTSGALLWGANNLAIFTNGSLQFGNFPYFVPDGSGGAVFSWYTNSPSLQCYAQHILANGTAAFAQGGVAVSSNTVDVRVAPSAAYRASTQEVFVFWTEEDSNQFVNGVYGQKFDSSGNPQWGATGLVLVPLGADTQDSVTTVQTGSGALVFWVDTVSYGNATIQATKLDDSGSVVCSQFVVSSTPSNRYALAATTNPGGATALVWTDDRIGNNGIYVQNVNPDCSLGPQ